MNQNTELLNKIQHLWSLTQEPVFHRNVANDIYFSQKGPLDVVLRLTPSSQRTADEIVSELAWINHLKNNSLKVCETVKSVNQKEIETVQHGNTTYHVVVFKKVPGERLPERSLNMKIVKNWAHSLAQMHNLAEVYSPPAGVIKRNYWDTDSAFLKSLESHGESGENIRNETLKIISWMKTQPQRSDNFGLIHADLHSGNFFCKDNELYIFDFDDSCHHWFLYDLTIPVMSILRDYEGTHFRKEQKLYINSFFEFYFEKRTKPDNWKNDFVKFYKFRCFFTHFWLLSIRKERNLNEKMAANFEKSIEWDAFEALNPQVEELINF
ncbi:phosphotransferase [bacterium]|nr:phosphotransferase [bacterium]